MVSTEKRERGGKKKKSRGDGSKRLPLVQKVQETFQGVWRGVSLQLKEKTLWRNRLSVLSALPADNLKRLLLCSWEFPLITAGVRLITTESPEHHR